MTDARIEELKGLLPRCMLPDWVRLGSRLARVLRDRRHAGSHDAVIDRLLERGRASVALREWRAEHRPSVTVPADLPIAARHEDLVAAIRAHQVVVVAGETGSGKTTQIPKMCLEAGLGIEARIGCTQPRRVAALSVSRRIAEELGVGWGREVGCKIRFDDRSSPETFIKLMTDGMLLAEVQGDPLLSEYNAIVLDEAHERSLNIDFLLGHLKGLLTRRDDLKLIITSATIDTATFAEAFGGAPIIEVSGRLYPVEVEYRPLSAEEEESGECTYVDAAVRAVESVVDDGAPGDVLVFMPGERDIRETTDQLEGRLGGKVEVVPLFGRLSAGDQQRVFATGGRRRVVVATNIAETSLTIPGIRYVVDTGLARISRYSPRTRTRRLPIEAIAQSNANQRKGRAGRVESGICIRLYSEEDFEGRPVYGQPEIQRANLAEVILRMKAFHLGDIETFPFLDPPTPAAVRSGYALLEELGALDPSRELTPLGRDLARLPIDPTLGRMLLESQREHATRELLIIASGLSIQDPRERPMERQAEAEAAHRRHVHPRSDFLTLLNLWEAVHGRWEALRTQGQRRKFCRENFLSYVRMREWQDLHGQLWDALEELGTVRLNESNAAYEAVHRSVLSGLLAHVGRREERNRYKGAGNRIVHLFPGSALFERGERPERRGKGGGRADEDRGTRSRSAQPAWVVAGEIVETTQVFARTVAGIDPEWIVAVAPHLCEVTHRDPRWSADAGRVGADEITTLYGMEVRRRWVAYGPIDPVAATDIFIRSALVAEELLPRPGGLREDEGPVRGERAGKAAWRDRLGSWSREEERPREWPPRYRFVERNRQVREAVENWRTRVRRHDLGDVDGALHAFYARHLEHVSSRDDLDRWLGERGAAGPESLCVSEAELAGGGEIAYDREAFPDTVQVGGQPVALHYAYAPGEEHDGVTVRVPFTLADAVSPAMLEWAVPGLREAKAEEWLRALPKSLRARLLPIAPKAAEMAREFRPEGPSLGHDLARFIRERYGVAVPPDAWAADTLPQHLRARVEVIGPEEKPLLASRDWASVRRQLAEVKPAAPAKGSAGDDAWRKAATRWERCQVTTWSFGDLPERVTVREGPGLPEYAWPGLEVAGEAVDVRLFRTRTEAQAKTAAGWRRLVELALGRDVAWLRKDLRALNALGPLYAPIGTAEELEETAYRHLMAHGVGAGPSGVMTEPVFRAAVEAARGRLAGLPGPWIERLRSILELRWEAVRRMGGEGVTASAGSGPARVVKDLSQLGQLALGARTAPALPAGRGPVRVGEAELGELMGARFLERVSMERLAHYPRYLKALLLRIERAGVNPVKDREREAQVAPWAAAWRAAAAKEWSEEKRRELETFRWMIEEFRVSLFAQELGTPTPVSSKRLEAQWERLRLLA